MKGWLKKKKKKTKKTKKTKRLFFILSIFLFCVSIFRLT